MGKHYPKMQCSMTTAALSIFWCVNKNSANWCVQQSYGMHRKTAYLILLNLYFILKHQVLFSLKNNEKKLMTVICCSRDWHFQGDREQDAKTEKASKLCPKHLDYQELLILKQLQILICFRTC